MTGRSRRTSRTETSASFCSPVDYLWFRFCLFLSGRATYLTVAFIPIALVIYFLRDSLVLPPDFATFATFLVSVALTALLQFFLSYTMAMLAFWVMEISTFVFILYAFEYIASGHVCSRSTSCRRW